MTRMPAPPAHVLPFVDVLGVDGAVAFLLEFGGANLYFAERPQDRGRLVRAIGRDAVMQLSEMMLPRRVPTAKPWIACVMRARGLPIAQIARNLHVSDVTVRAWLKKGQSPGAPQDDPQLRLI